MLIVLFGPDGSGKSTLARALAEEFKRRNLRVTVSWMRGTHTLASLLASFLSTFNTLTGSDNPYYGISIPPNLRRLWQFLEFFSALPIILYRFILPNLLGYYVVAERYVLDLVAWVSITTRDPRFPMSVESKVLLALARKCITGFYITATLDKLVERSGMDESGLEKQLKIYDVIAKSVDVHIIDTSNKSVEESLKEILSVLEASKS